MSFKTKKSLLFESKDFFRVIINERHEKRRIGARLQFYKPSVIMGKRLFNTVSVMKKEGNPGDTYNVRVPKLSSNQVFIPDTMNVTFNFLNGNTKSRFKNNLGRILCNDLIVYNNDMEGMFETYKDLWKSDSKRKEML